MSFIIPKDIKEYETPETIDSAVSILNTLKGKTPLEIDRICQSITKIAKSNAIL